MKNKNRKASDFPSSPDFPLGWRLLATSLGTGYLPLMPGTWAAMLAVLLWLPLYIWASPVVNLWVTVAATIAVTVLGTHASTVSERFWGKDPVIANVDEVVGQWISMLPLYLGVAVIPWWELLAALALFRLFDIFKPLGIRSLERFKGGWGMMVDDIASGIVAALILLALNIWVLHINYCL